MRKREIAFACVAIVVGMKVAEVLAAWIVTLILLD